MAKRKKTLLRAEEMDDIEYSAYLLVLLIKEINGDINESAAFPLVYQFLTDEVVDEESAMSYGVLIAATSIAAESGLH